MNAGGHGSDMASCLAGVRVIDLRSGEDGEVPASALALGYRPSALAPHQLVVWADLAPQEGEPDRSAALISPIVTWRRANQPGGANAGSVFPNPARDSAGRLIEEAGCKGVRLGAAEVCSTHANFIPHHEGGNPEHQ